MIVLINNAEKEHTILPFFLHGVFSRNHAHVQFDSSIIKTLAASSKKQQNHEMHAL